MTILLLEMENKMSIANELIIALNEAKAAYLEVNLQEVSEGIKVSIYGDGVPGTENVCDTLEEVVSFIKRWTHLYGPI